jgi:hypothetical protein
MDFYNKYIKYKLKYDNLLLNKHLLKGGSEMIGVDVDNSNVMYLKELLDNNYKSFYIEYFNSSICDQIKILKYAITKKNLKIIKYIMYDKNINYFLFLLFNDTQEDNNYYFDYLIAKKLINIKNIEHIFKKLSIYNANITSFIYLESKLYILEDYVTPSHFKEFIKPLILVQLIKNTEVCIYLLEKFEFEERIDFINNSFILGYNIFVHACLNNNFELVRYLISNGASINSTIKDIINGHELLNKKVTDSRIINLIQNMINSEDMFVI